MKYQRSVNIWGMSRLAIGTLQPGQWVYAGDPSNMGRFWGLKDTGTICVAWQGNAQGRGKGGYWQYQRAVHDNAAARRVRAVLVPA